MIYPLNPFSSSRFHFSIQEFFPLLHTKKKNGGRLFSIQYYFCLNMQPYSLIQSSNRCLLRTHYTVYSGSENKDEVGADYTAAIFSSTEDLYRIKSKQMNVTPTSCITKTRSSISYTGTISQWSWGWQWTLTPLPLLPIWWNYRCVPQHPAYSEWTQGFLHMRFSASWVTPGAPKLYFPILSFYGYGYVDT